MGDGVKKDDDGGDVEKDFRNDLRGVDVLFFRRTGPSRVSEEDSETYIKMNLRYLYKT